MRTLLFQNNIHNTVPIEMPGEVKPRAINLTVRKGLKWADLLTGEEVKVSDSRGDRIHDINPLSVEEVYATIYDVKVISFADLMNYHKMLKLGQDPYCRTYIGLFETMRKVYDGFLQHELVTLVFYELEQDAHSQRPPELE